MREFIHFIGKRASIFIEGCLRSYEVEDIFLEQYGFLGSEKILSVKFENDILLDNDRKGCGTYVG